MAARLIADFRVRHPNGPEIAANLDLDFRGGPVCVLFGPSGAGKTTVLRALAGLRRPESGSIRFGDAVWFDSDRAVWVPPRRRRVGLLFQDYALFPHLTAEGNVAYGLRAWPRERREARVAELFEMLRIGALRGRKIGALAGGEKQRVALARALAPRPELLLLDEPLSALDAPSREGLREELRETLLAARTPAIAVTHDRSEALTLGDSMIVLIEGRAAQSGPVAEVFRSPADAAVARALGVESVIPARVARVEGGLAWYAAGEHEVIGLAPTGAVSPEGFLCIRGEDVTLAREPHGDESARNHLPAEVTDVVDHGVLVRVRLDCTFPLTAWITRQARSDLGIEVGARVWAAVKAPAARFVPHRAAPSAADSDRFA